MDPGELGPERTVRVVRRPDRHVLLHAAPRPFPLADMPHALRPPATVALVTVTGWAVALLLAAFGYGAVFDRRADLYGLMNDGPAAAALVRVATALGFGVAAWVATAAATHPDWVRSGKSRFGRRLILLGVAGLGAIFASDVVDLASVSSAGGAWSAERVRLLWCRAFGWVGLIALVALPFLPHRSTFGRRLSLLFAAAPFAIWVTASFAMGDLVTNWGAGPEADPQADLLRRTSVDLELALVLFLAWEVVVWAELVASGAASVAKHALASGRVVLFVIVAKAVWVGAGYSGVLSPLLGGNAPSWSASARDGIGAWVTASAIAVVLILALKDRRQVSDQLSVVPWRPLLIIMMVLYLPGLLVGLNIMMLPLHLLMPDGPFELAVLAAVAVGAAGAVLAAGAAEMVEPPPSRVLTLVAVNACLLAGLVAGLVDLYLDMRAYTSTVDAEYWPSLPSLPVSAITAHYFLAPGATFVVAALLTVRAWHSMRDGLREHDLRWLPPATFVLTLAAVAAFYVAPRIPQVPLSYRAEDVGASGDMLAPQYSHSVYSVEPATWERWWSGPAGTFHPATLDAVLTVGLCVLSIRRWRGQRGNWSALSLVLIGSTVLAHSSDFTPNGWLGSRWYYIAFLVPLLWQFMYRGHELTQLVRRAPHLTVLNLAVVVLLMTLIGHRLLTGTLNLGLQFEDLVLSYTGGFTASSVLLPLGIIAIARRLHGRVQ